MLQIYIDWIAWASLRQIKAYPSFEFEKEKNNKINENKIDVNSDNCSTL